MSKKRLLIALKAALSVLLMWYLLGKVDLGAAAARAADLDSGPLAMAFALLLLQAVLAAWRWLTVLEALAAPLPFGQAFRLFFVGAFFNQVLPGAVGGDAVRAYQTYKAGLGLAPAVNSVMLERAATVLALVFMVAAMQPLLAARIGDNPALLVFPLLSVAGIAGVLVLSILDRLPASLRRWRLVRGLAHLAAGTRALFFRPRNAVAVLAVSVLGHVNLALAVYALAVGLDISVSPLDCMILVPPVILVTTLPISIAGWGVREGAMVTAFGFIGVPAESALVLSLIFGITVVVASLPGGVLWLAGGGRRTAIPEELPEIEGAASQSGTSDGSR
jgi:uncharacterized protein (TIRG00374 family)